MFYAGTEIKRGSRVGTLANEIKKIWPAWSKTKKDLPKTRREN
jgi:hypothetical protein